MIIERQAVIEHWKKELNVEQLGNIHCDLIEENDEMRERLHEKDMIINRLEHENFVLMNVIDALTRNRPQNKVE